MTSEVLFNFIAYIIFAMACLTLNLFIRRGRVTKFLSWIGTVFGFAAAFYLLIHPVVQAIIK